MLVGGGGENRKKKNETVFDQSNSRRSSRSAPQTSSMPVDQHREGKSAPKLV